MRVNEENFTTGDVEDVEPSYVEQVVGNHNSDEEAHPDIRNLINQTQAFYQNAKNHVEGVAEAARNSAREATESAKFAADEAVAASEAKAEAVNAKEAAESCRDEAESAMDESRMCMARAEDAANRYPYIGDNGNWYVFDVQLSAFVNSGIPAQGEKGDQGVPGKDGESGQDGYTPVRGVDYWVLDDIAEIKAYVDEAILGGEW